MAPKILLLTLALASCSTNKVAKAPESTKLTPPKEFSRGEVILANQLLTKIFDREMAALECVPDTEEAALLLRTLTPRMEMVQDDIEAVLDDSKEVSQLIADCDQNCTCSFVDELLREHLVSLTKEERKSLMDKKKAKDLNSCLNYVQATFCQSDLYRTLNQEKIDFSFEDSP